MQPMTRKSCGRSPCQITASGSANDTDVRGMVAQVDTYAQAEQELADDQAGCRKQGGYSDARIYQDDGNGHWEIAHWEIAQ